jgi:hypothetical protein
VRVSVAALVLLFLLPGCGVQTSKPGRDAEPVETKSLRARLDTVVVPVYDVGGLPAGLRVTPDSGWVDNRLEARNSYDRKDSAASLARAGRVSGYQLTYYDPTQAALRSGEGLHAVLTYAELFSNAKAASMSLRDRVGFARGLENKSPRSGVRFGAVKPFPVKAADEAQGLREVVRYGNDQVFRTLAGFRRGRVVGTVMVVRVDQDDGSALAERMVGILDSRIQIALHGGSNGNPVAIPEDSGSPNGQRPAAPVRPAGVPDLARIALGPADLPPGIPCNPGEYTHTTSPRITFRRSFCPQGRAVGRTRLLSLTSEVNVFESETAARASLSLSAQAAASPDALDTFAANFSSTEGLVATNVRSQRLDLGGGAVGILFSFDTEAGRLVDLYALAQRGRGVTTLDAAGPAKTFHRGDLLRLLRIVERRLASFAKPS